MQVDSDLSEKGVLIPPNLVVMGVGKLAQKPNSLTSPSIQTSLGVDPKMLMWFWCKAFYFGFEP